MYLFEADYGPAGKSEGHSSIGCTEPMLPTEPFTADQKLGNEIPLILW